MTKQRANAKGRRMPSVATIVKYWRAQDAPIAVDWNRAGEYCWRCARELNRGTSDKHSEDDDCRHKSHIVPRALGGSDDASNLIVLCRWCHAQAPDVADPAFMWEWLKKTSLGCDRLWHILTRSLSVEHLRVRQSQKIRHFRIGRCPTIDALVNNERGFSRIREALWEIPSARNRLDIRNVGWNHVSVSRLM